MMKVFFNYILNRGDDVFLELINYIDERSKDWLV